MKRIIRTLLFIAAFYFLFLFQTGIAFRLGISGPFLCLIIFLLFLLIIFENPQKKDGVIVAIFTGIFWDFFSLKPFGIYALILGISAFFIKFLLEKYAKPIPRQF